MPESPIETKLAWFLRSQRSPTFDRFVRSKDGCIHQRRGRSLADFDAHLYAIPDGFSDKLRQGTEATLTSQQNSLETGHGEADHRRVPLAGVLARQWHPSEFDLRGSLLASQLNPTF
jgi:hypothetical protein